MQTTAEHISYLHDHELQDYMNDIKNTFRSDNSLDVETIQKAITFVRSGAIQSYTHDPSKQVISVYLLDNEEKITVNLALHQSHAICSCDKTQWCEHRIAVVFHLYIQQHSLNDWLHEWRKTQREEMIFKLSERTPEAWNRSLAQLMEPIRTIDLSENPSIFIHSFSLIEDKAMPLAPFEWEWKPLFNLFFHLHAINAAWSYIQYHLDEDATQFAYGKWYVRNWLSDQLEKISTQIQSVAQKPKLFETDPFHDELKVLVRNIVLYQPGLFEKKFRIYKELWQTLFTHAKMRTEEVILLQQINAPDTTILLTYLQLLDGREMDIVVSLDQATDSIDKWLPLAEFAEEEALDEALHTIMEAILPHIGDYFQNVVPLSRRPHFARKIDGLLETADFPEAEREKMFTLYGELGVDVYADFLIERERFQEWAALMHHYKVPYDIAEAGGLKVAILNDPPSVLPLLHIYVQQFIEEKNRQSYRRATNLLKKMKISCRKSNKHDFWNAYVNQLRNKHRRLRALLEEIEKGNVYL